MVQEGYHSDCGLLAVRATAQLIGLAASPGYDHSASCMSNMPAELLPAGSHTGLALHARRGTLPRYQSRPPYNMYAATAVLNCLTQHTPRCLPLSLSVVTDIVMPGVTKKHVPTHRQGSSVGSSDACLVISQSCHLPRMQTVRAKCQSQRKGKGGSGRHDPSRMRAGH